MQFSTCGPVLCAVLLLYFALLPLPSSLHTIHRDKKSRMETIWNWKWRQCICACRADENSTSNNNNNNDGEQIVVLNFLFIKSRNEQYSREASSSSSKSIGGEQNEIKHIDTKSVALVMCAKVIYSHHHLYYTRKIEQFVVFLLLLLHILSISPFFCKKKSLFPFLSFFVSFYRWLACLSHSLISNWSSEDFAAKIPTAIRH